MDLVRRLDYNTGGRQPPVTREASIRAALCRRKKPSRVDAEIKTARDNDRIFRYNYNGTAYLGLDDVDALRSKIESYVERREDPRTDLIGIANEWITEYANE